MSGSRWNRALRKGAVIALFGLLGCHPSTPEAGSAGIPDHRGPSSVNMKKKSVRPSRPPRAQQPAR
jgi:hypothetical protein